MKELLEIAKYIVVGGFGGVILVIMVLFLNPEKIEKWSVILWKIVYFICKKGEKKIVAHDIQGRVNEFAKSLKKELANFNPVGISIQWVTEKETPTEFLQENRLVIRMRQHIDQNKNFVYASMVFISRAVLTKAKKYISQTQKESIDLYIGRKLFEKEKPQIVDRFFEDYFAPKAIEKDKIMELLEKYEVIDKLGLFFPVLIQELIFLGEKVFYKPKNEKIIVEVSNFIDFLQNYTEREIGDETVPNNFEGLYCRCGLVIIAKRLKREIGDAAPFINYINRLLTEKKLENIYLIGSASVENMNFVDQISEDLQKRFNLQKYASRILRAKIKIKGERKEVSSYLILFRSSEILRYYDKEYQEKFIETA